MINNSILLKYNPKFKNVEIVGKTEMGLQLDSFIFINLLPDFRFYRTLKYNMFVSNE